MSESDWDKNCIHCSGLKTVPDNHGGEETCPCCHGTGKSGVPKEKGSGGGACMVVIAFFLTLSSAAVYCVSKFI